MKQELITFLLGKVTPVELIGCCFMALVGIVLHFVWGVMKRDPLSSRTPIHFSMSFLLSDNGKRILSNLVLIFLGVPVLVIFSEKLLGLELNAWVGLVIGVGFDFYMKKLFTFDEQSKKTKMEYWDLTFRNEADEVVWPSGNKTLGEFANATAGTLSGKVVTYTADPGFASVDIIDANDLKSYTAGPIKRPV